jgi:hypothetical protein
MIAETKKPRLFGRKIVKIDWNEFHTGRGADKSTDPTLWLDDGSFVTFTVRETEVGEYGVEICWHRPGIEEA